MPLGWSLAGMLLLGALGLAVLPRGAAVTPSAEAVLDPAEAAAVRVLRTRLRTPDAAEFRAVRVHRPGGGDERAVCGRILAADLPGGMADFVARVILRGTERPGTLPMVILEDGPGVLRATPGAQQRYCHDSPHRALPAPTDPAPPLLSTPLPGERLAGDRLAGAGIPVVAAQGGGAALGAAVVRSPVNLRANPGGGGAVLSTLPRGLAVTVFARAPGGWLQVGDTGPWGWVHSSLMADQAP